jgi:hypothetical protein
MAFGLLGILARSPRLGMIAALSVLNTPTQILLHGHSANISFVGSPDCVLPDASGKFFAHF